MIIKYRSSSIQGKIHKSFWDLRPFFNFEKFSALKNGFRSISFEINSVLDSNFIHRYIIIKCKSSSIKGKIHQLFWELWFPFHNF